MGGLVAPGGAGAEWLSRKQKKGMWRQNREVQKQCGVRKEKSRENTREAERTSSSDPRSA